MSGKQFIAGQRVATTPAELTSINARSGAALPWCFSQATHAEANDAASAAAASFRAYQALPLTQRAAFLDAIADEIDRLDDGFIQVVMEESGLPEARIKGERTRTSTQMRLFANVVRDRHFAGVRIDSWPGKPEIRQYQVGIGPVAVFGASNFPLAFSTAGGDTAAALAAGCPVVFKAHSGHMRTAELTAVAIERARVQCGIPAGVFNMIFGARIGADLVRHPQIKAVGFTGSLAGGKALLDIANARPQPIPVFAEMSSINPMIMLDTLLKNQGEQVAADLVASFTLGTGQFCTKPGLIFGIRSPAFEQFAHTLAAKVNQLQPMVMLNPATLHAYQQRSATFDAHPGLKLLAQGEAATLRAGARLYRIDAADLLADNQLIQEEIFGPAAIIVSADHHDQLLQVLEVLNGQLTASIYGEDAELADAGDLIAILQEKAGRLIVNGYPTGVEVCHAMTHGGPWPATSDARGTSVGSLAINRFLRPVSFQNTPQSLLPPLLQDKNLTGVPVLRNGHFHSPDA